MDQEGEREEPVTEPRTIDDLRKRACTPIALSLTSAFGSGPPRERFDAAMELTERIAKRACEFLNSVYLHSARLAGATIPEVERKLVELGRKNMSFGDYVSSIEFFLRVLGPSNLHASVAPFWSEFAVPLRGMLLPQAVSEDNAALDLIKTARTSYEIPVSSIKRYVDDHRGGGLKKLSVATVLSMAATYRNAKAHHHAWFADEPLWYALIMERWRRILEQVVLHAPVYRLLATVEVVSTRADMRIASAGRFLSDASRDELHELVRPMTESRIESTEPLSPGRHWARRTEDDAAPLLWLFPWRDFPENVEPPAVREQRYRARSVKLYLAVGALRATDVDATLRALRTELGIEDKAAQALQEEVIGAIRAAEAEVRGGEDKGAAERLITLIRHFESEFPDMKHELALLDERRAQTVHLLIADQFPISHPSLLHASEMHAEDLERALQRLLSGTDPTRVVRKVEPAPGRAYYRIPSTRAAEEFTATIDRIGNQPKLVEELRPLLEICQQFFAEEGHPDLPGAISQVLRRGGYDGGVPVADEASLEAPHLLFAARGQVVKESSVPDLLREIVRRFGADQALQQKIPFASGRTRYLVAREARHAGGQDFIRPLEFKEHGLIFEANQSRLSALKSLRQWFTDAQISVERAEIDGQSIDELGAQGAGVEAAGAASSDEDLILHIRLGERPEKVSGPTAGTFLSRIVTLLVEEGKLTVEQLPVRIGRVRYLIAQEPKHANGRRFDSPVEAEGMYIESALTRADARFHATTLCLSAGVEVIDGAAVAEVVA